MKTAEFDQASLAAIAVAVHHYLTSGAERLDTQITTLAQEIARIERLTLMSEDIERGRALAESKSHLSDATAQLESILYTAGFLGWRAPVLSTQARLAVRRARHAYIEAERAFDEPTAQAQRARDIALHNQHVANERSRLSALRSDRSSCVEQRDGIKSFHKSATDALHAATGDGWTARDFATRFRTMAALVQAGDLSGATDCLAALTFQRRPSDTTYMNWQSEAITVRDRAYREYEGMAASGSYSEIAARSIELGQHVLREKAAKTVGAYCHPSDQWQALSHMLTDPRQFKVDALWAIYWAMFQCGQWAASALSETDDNENIFTGKLSAQLDRWLVDWAARHVPRFGYPNVASYMGTLDIANKSEETRLGADLGLIVDLQLGDFVCRKVALFQAKIVRHGMTDLGSKSQQLPMLAASPQKGFYLFYHQSASPVRAPAPTICSARTLADMVVANQRHPDARHLNFNVRTLGWDWASFISFGLCQPDSGVGEHFSTPQNALETLGGGDPRHLPKHLHFIAIADEPRVAALRRQIQEHYRVATLARSKNADRSRRRERDIDGPELGPSL